MPVAFSQVKQILDELIAAWKKQHGRDPDLPGAHADPNFGWQSRDQLINSTGFGLQLIDPALIGNGKGHETNLVIALTTGVLGYPRMPLDGPYLDQSKVATLVQWINDGCPSDDAAKQYAAVAYDVTAVATLDMRDPEVNKQADLQPYPDGPGKTVHKWEVTVGFNKTPGTPIQVKVKGIPGGTAGVRPGNVFDLIRQDDVFQDTGYVYDGKDAKGCVVLHRAQIGESQAPVYDKKADHFPDPARTYPFRRMGRNGRWFLVQWTITHADGKPTLQLTAAQQPRVNSVSERKCP